MDIVAALNSQRLIGRIDGGPLYDISLEFLIGRRERLNNIRSREEIFHI